MKDKLKNKRKKRNLDDLEEKEDSSKISSLGGMDVAVY